MNNNKAFTLAEVLITLGIIGIVAALTLPVLMNNINGQKYRSQFKKTFSTLTQAAKTAQQAYEMSFAGINESCLEDGSDAPTRHSMCGMLNGALSGATYLGSAGNIYNGLDIQIGDYAISNYDVYRLSDGSFVGFNRNMANCSVPTGTILTENVLTGSGALKSCLGFIDVNGNHNPNEIVAGVDINFSSQISNPTYSNYTGTNYTGSGSGSDSYIYVDNCSCLGDMSCPCTEYSGRYVIKPGVPLDSYLFHEGTRAPSCQCAGDNTCPCVEIGGDYFLKLGVTMDEYNLYMYGPGSGEAGANPSAPPITGTGYMGTGYSGAGYNHTSSIYVGNAANAAPFDDSYSCDAASFNPNAVCIVENKKGQISDIFPIVFHDGVVEPASGAAKAVLHQTK